MGRFTRTLIIAVPLVLLVSMVVLSLMLGRVVKMSLEHYVPQMMETEVRIESAHFNPLIGRVLLKGTEVDNPEGFSDGQAFTFDEVGVLIRMGSLFSDEIHIREIRLREPQVFYERRVRDSNISRLIANIEGSSVDEKPEPDGSGSDGNVRFRIDRLLIEEGRIAVGIGPGAIRLTLPQVEMSDLGSEGRGLTLDQTVLLVLRIIGRSVGDAATDVPGNVFDRIRGLFQSGNDD